MEGTGMLSGAPVKQQGKKLWQYLSAVSACVLSIGVGTGLAWTSPVMNSLEDPESWAHLNKEQVSWISSLLAIGAMLGALPAGAIANAIGRKRCLLFLSVPFFLSWAIIIFANQVWMLYAARTIVGIGIGASCVLVPTYLSEIAEPSIRGTLGAMFQLFLTMGILYTFILGALLSYTWLAIFCVAIEFLFVGTFIIMPDSPAWLISQNRKTEASDALRRLRGGAYDINLELAQMQKEAEENASNKSSVFDLVRLPAPRKALLISCAGMVFQQLCGINAVIFYSKEIFEASNSIDPDLGSILVSIVQCSMAVVAAVVVDKAGRKPLLIFSATLMAISLVALGYFFRLKETEADISSLTWLPLVSLICYMVAFSIGMGPIPWMLTSEVFTAEHIGNASSLAVMLNWFLVFLVTKTFQSIVDAFKRSGAFWIFAGIMVFAAVFSFFVIPETKGKTSQEIQRELEGNKRNRSV